MSPTRVILGAKAATRRGGGGATRHHHQFTSMSEFLVKTAISYLRFESGVPIWLAIDSKDGQISGSSACDACDCYELGSIHSLLRLSRFSSLN
uniref:Uncharacterized protein n=1 Tax=Triticum urartu TaxID=4572 RepID=A0A8R7PNR7_TRIUA